MSTVEALKAALRDQVLDGTLPGGAALREADLSEAFGVSRHTVRTALQALVHEGLLQHSANRGARVPNLTPDDIRDVYRLRTVLELDAARTLAGDRERLAPARAAIERLKTLDGADWGLLRDADLAFHQALVDALGRPRTSRTFALLIAELRLCFRQVRDEFEAHPDEIAADHERLLRTLESGDPEDAVDQLRHHLDVTCEDIAQRIARSSEASA